MSNREQYSRKNNIEISGLPVRRGEDVRSVLRDVSAAIGVQMKEERGPGSAQSPELQDRRDTTLGSTVRIEAVGRAVTVSWIDW